MNQALVNLIVFVGAVAIIWLIVKVYGKKSWMESKLRRQKTLTEDILKQLYHVEQSKQVATLDNLSGALQLSRKKIYPVVETMTTTGLVNLSDKNIQLTEEGRQYALKIIRIHRLWEKYLAEKTGHQPSEWHDLAEKMEHKLNEEDISKLDTYLGNPMFDPHGDPIPTELGVMNPVKWIPLPSYSVDKPGKISHIEDEPHVIYQQILDKRIFVGSHIKLIKSSDNEVTFICEGQEHRFSSIVAANIHVEPLNEDEVFEENAIRLSSLQLGETAEVIGLSKECRGANRRRLLDLGILPGTAIEIDIQSPMHDPIAYRVRNTSIALRNSLADLILINKITYDN